MQLVEMEMKEKLYREKTKMFWENSVFAFSGLGVKCDEQVIQPKEIRRLYATVNKKRKFGV